jgi:hypothetical protein
MQTDSMAISPLSTSKKFLKKWKVENHEYKFSKVWNLTMCYDEIFEKLMKNLKMIGAV